MNEQLTLRAALENVTDEDDRIHGSGVSEPGINFIFGLGGGSDTNAQFRAKNRSEAPRDTLPPMAQIPPGVHVPESEASASYPRRASTPPCHFRSGKS